MGFKEKVNPSVQSIADLFTENNYRIPVYQRGYSWGYDQVLDLWEDLMEVVNGDRDSHFFGQLVTFNAEDDRQELIDGQQRVTTSQILLAVIKNIAHQIETDLKDDESLNFSDFKILSKNSNIQDMAMGALEDGQRLITSKSSDEDNVQVAFVNLIRNGRTLENKSDNAAVNNMWNAYDNFNNWVQKELYKLKLNDKINRLEMIFNSFFKQFYVVKVLAPNRQDAFTIFETLNSRGADLTASDIIKSHIISLLSLNDDNIKDASSKWNQVSRSLKSDSKQINNFIRSYWAAKNNHVTVSKLYRKIIQSLNTENEAKEFLNETVELVPVYETLQTAGRKKYFENKRINHTLNILGKIKFTLYYPVVLALDHVGEPDATILQVLNKILSLFVRYRLICNKTTNQLENAFSSVAIKIWRGDLYSPNSIINELDKYNVSDSEVNAAFSTLHKLGALTGPKRWVLNYLLANIYEASENDFVSENEMYDKVFANGDYVPVHINSSIEFQELEDYLGNWTMIEGVLHSNKDTKYSMAEIVKLLKESELVTNHQIAQQIEANDYQWTQSDIERHQAKLGHNVTEIWH